MKKDEHISEEQLNAFVDGELESEEQSCLFDEAEQSTDLDQRLCQQRKIKELVKHAYRDIPEPRRLTTGRPLPRSVFSLAMAATLFLVIGFTTGLFTTGYLDKAARPDTFAADARTQAAVLAENYILHVASGEPKTMRLALRRARELLDSGDAENPRRVEIIANDRGLDLLRSDVTPFGDEIRALSHENVMFYACSKAIERLEEKGVEVRLVPEAIPGFTALDRVVERMQDGWQYIKL
jgi:intracellular sulfur oxidation DsrE/DsrF family protein